MAAAALSFPIEWYDDEMVAVPRGSVKLPLVIPTPPGFVVDDLDTWPKFPGRLEFVNGRLEFMPPCGVAQNNVAPVIGAALVSWCDSHPDFRAGGNEAGMKLGEDVRGADAAIFRKAGSPATHAFYRVPPVLAVEVMGRDDTLALLQEKAVWYLAHGVETVWIVDPDKREAHVVTASSTVMVTDVMPEPASLPGLTPRVESFFRQL